MKYLLTVVFAMILTGCAGTNFVATPNPAEVSTISYQRNHPQFTEAWQFVNNDLTMHYTKKDKQGVTLAKKVQKLTPNEYNWLVTMAESADYTKIESPSKVKRTQYVGRRVNTANSPEVVTVINHEGAYTFQRLGRVQLPNGIDTMASKIPLYFGQ